MKILNWLCAGWLAIGVGQLDAADWSFKRWQEKDGTQVLFYQAMEVPMLDISVAFPAGSARDNTRQGLATLTANMLNQGAEGMGANAIAIALENTGAQYNADINRDMVSFNLRTLTEPQAMAQSISVLATMLSHPNFPEKAFQRQQQQQIMAIKESSQSLDRVANDAFYQSLYGQHPYAHPVMGTIDDVAALKIDDLKHFYQQYYNQQNAIVVIVGAIEEQQAKQIAQQLTQNLSSGNKAEPIPEAHALTKAISMDTRFPSSQTALRIGQLGISHQTPHYFALQVGNYILGGGSLVSRLAVEVREHRGLTYGVSSAFEPLPALGPFLISLSTKTDQAEQAMSLTLSILKDFILSGPDEKELIAAKKYLTGSFPLSLASNRGIANMLLRIAFYRLPDDFLESYTRHVNQVKASDIRDAFKSQINPEKLLTIKAGP